MREWIGLAVIALPCLLYSMDLTVMHLAVPRLTEALAPSSVQLLCPWRRPSAADAAVVVDGGLDEPVWARAARLRQFSQDLPNDNRPADDSTTTVSKPNRKPASADLRAQ